MWKVYAIRLQWYGFCKFKFLCICFGEQVSTYSDNLIHKHRNIIQKLKWFNVHLKWVNRFNSLAPFAYFWLTIHTSSKWEKIHHFVMFPLIFNKCYITLFLMGGGATCSFFYITQNLLVWGRWNFLTFHKYPKPSL